VLFDWFTILAQIVNFLVLVALMKRFLYGPLIAAIDAREQSIAARIARAAQKEEEATTHIEQLAKEAAETEGKKAAVLAAAQEDADRQRGEILARARENVRALEAKWRDELEREKGAFLDDVRRRAAAEILAATRSALRDLACADVQCCAMNAFLAKLQALDPGQLRALAKDGMTVVSREDLPAEMRHKVEKPSKIVWARPQQLHLNAFPPWHGASNCEAMGSASAGRPTPIWIPSKTSFAPLSTKRRRPAIR